MDWHFVHSTNLRAIVLVLEHKKNLALTKSVITHTPRKIKFLIRSVVSCRITLSPARPESLHKCTISRTRFKLYSPSFKKPSMAVQRPYKGRFGAVFQGCQQERDDDIALWTLLNSHYAFIMVAWDSPTLFTDWGAIAK
jgi:hypothetical protein